jgi:hypothetical protein
MTTLAFARKLTPPTAPVDPRTQFERWLDHRYPGYWESEWSLADLYCKLHEFQAEQHHPELPLEVNA